MRTTLASIALALSLSNPSAAQEAAPEDKLNCPVKIDEDDEAREFPEYNLAEESPAQTSARYDIIFGLHTYKDTPKDLRSALQQHAGEPPKITHKEMIRLKLGLDHAAGAAAHLLTKTSSGAEFKTRAAILTGLIAAVGGTSRWAHEEAGHNTAHSSNGILYDEFTLPDETYEQISDQIAGGLNTSEDLFFAYQDHATKTRLTLATAIGSIAAKLDPLIQWTYSYHFSNKTDGKIDPHSLNDQAPDTIFDHIGLGDNRAYVRILNARHPKATKNTDLALSLASTALTAHTWQSALLGIKYLLDGTTSQKPWELSLANTAIRPPAFGIYRLPQGYFGRTDITGRINSLVFTLTYGTELRFAGSRIREKLFGLGIANISFGPINIDANAKITLQNSIKGYALGTQISYALATSENYQLRASIGIEHTHNDILRREGFPKTDTLFEAGLEFLIKE